MSEDSHLKVSENSLKLAQTYATEKNFGRAFCHYLVAIKLRPDWKELVKDEFCIALCKWGTFLEEKEKIQDLFQCYEQALDLFPNNEVILNNLGAHLLRCHLLKEATYYFHKCLKLKPNYLQAIYNLENVSNLAVERWHFRMLNDNYRNEAFREAIIKKIKQGFNEILDVGTGTGLLSLFCVEGKAKTIYACESSATMIEIAKEVFKKNNAEQVKLIEKHSSEIKVPQDMSRRVTLLVTETFDSGLLGEDILNTLSHAWKNLLHPPILGNPKCSGNGSVVIPFGAKLFITGIECDSISKMLYLKSTNNLFNLNFLSNTFKNDKYDTRDLKKINYKSLTDTGKIISINFNDPKFLENILQGNQNTKIRLKCVESGRLDCFAVWFDLLLDEDIVLNTGPQSINNTAWDQAIFHLQNSLNIEKHQEIFVNISFINGKLCLTLCEEEKKEFLLSEEIVKTLNDVKLVEALEEVKNKLVNEFNRSVCIMDWFPFPIFGFNFLLARRKHFKDHLTCFVPSESDKKYITLLAKHYDLENQILVIIDCDFEKNYSENVKFDIILLHCIDWTGEIKENCLIHLPLLKSLLNTHGIILPEQITAYGQLIHSDWLLQASKVLNNNVTCGYKIAEFINLYQVRHFIDFESEIQKTSLSDCVELCKLNLDNFEREIIVKCNSYPCTINSMLYWFEIQFMDGCKCFSTGDIDSIFHQSVFLFSDIEVYDETNFIVMYSKGLLSVQLKNVN